MDIAIVNFDAAVPMYQDTSLYLKRVLEENHRVTTLGCAQGLNRCTSFMSFGQKVDEAWLRKNRENVCGQCKRQQKRLGGVDLLQIDLGLDDIDDAQRLVLERLNSMEPMAARDFLSLEYDGAPLGRLAFFDFSLLNKLSAKGRLSSAQATDLLEHLRDAFRVWNFVGRVLKGRRFDAAVYVNGNYSLNSIARERLKRAGVQCWSVEFTWGNSEVEKKIYFERDRLAHGRSWPEMNKLRDVYKCRFEDCKLAIDGFRNRIYGIDFNSYSSPLRGDTWDRFDRFRAQYREIVSIFVSSGDELQVHEAVWGFEQDTQYFRDQSDWLQFMIDNANPEVGYVLRLHPRLKPNKREAIQAEEYHRLSSYLDQAAAKSNFLIVEADDPISSYYVLLQSDLTMVSWSLIALESAALGVPTVVCFPKNLSFPIEKMCEQPRDLSEIRRMFRRELKPQQRREHDVELLRWTGIMYGAIGVSVPGVRFARTIRQKLLVRWHRWNLSSRTLYSIFFRKRFRRTTMLSSAGELISAPDASPGGVDQSEESLVELENFRREARAFFRSGAVGKKGKLN